MKPSLSIIIPCYNCEITLEEAVNSCFAQGLNNFEVIMVNDGSTDETVKVMKKLSEQHKEIKIFNHEKNRGGGATRNTAVSNSQSDVIFCLDSDDLLPPNTLSRMLAYLQNKRCDGVTFHKSLKFNNNDTNDVNYIDESVYIGDRIPIESLVSIAKFCPVYVNFMYTKTAFNKFGGYPEKHGFDTQGFAWRFLCSGLVAYTCPDTTYLHRINFNESYYMREYNYGKSNYNWRDILLENYFVFNHETIKFISDFNCADFSISLIAELSNRQSIFINDIYSEVIKKHLPFSEMIPQHKYIRRNSLIGYFYRMRRKIVLIFTRHE